MFDGKPLRCYVSATALLSPLMSASWIWYRNYRNSGPRHCICHWAVFDIGGHVCFWHPPTTASVASCLFSIHRCHLQHGTVSPSLHLPPRQLCPILNVAWSWVGKRTWCHPLIISQLLHLPPSWQWDHLATAEGVSAAPLYGQHSIIICRMCERNAHNFEKQIIH